MGKFGRALLGGIAGGAGAAEEVFNQKIASNESQRKEKVLEKRQLALAKIQNDYAVERDTTKAKRVDDRTTAKNERDDTTKRMDRLYDEGQTEKDNKYKTKTATEKAEKKFDYDMKLQKERNLGYKTKDTVKKPSTSDKKFAKENAIETLSADFGMLGGEYLKDSNVIELPIGKTDPKMIQQMFAKVKAAGFTPTMSQDDKYITIRLGGFNYEQAQTGLAAPVEMEVVTDDRSKSVFDELYGALSKNKKPIAAPGSNLNDQQLNDGLKSSHSNSLALPTLHSIQR